MKTFSFFTLFLFSSIFKIEAQTTLSSKEIETILDRHNYWRADVGIAEKLEWSEEMADLAASWARQLKRNNCGWEHRPNNKFGENLFKGTTGYYSACLLYTSPSPRD